MKDNLRHLVERLMPSHVLPGVLKFHDNYVHEILNARGSSNNHQSWIGGYQDHIIQCLNLAVRQYEMLDALTPAMNARAEVMRLPFKLEQAALVLYFHDIEKISKYSMNCGTPTHYERKLAFNKEIWYYGILPEKYGIWFTDDEFNALEYVHGEHDYSKTERKMRPLAAFCHCVDVMSARIYFDVREIV